MENYASYKIKFMTTSELEKFYNPTLINSYCQSCTMHKKIWTCPPLPFKDIDYIRNYKFGYIINSKIYINKIPKAVADSYLINMKKKYTDISKDTDFNTSLFNSIYYAFREYIDEKLIKIEGYYPNSTSLVSGRCLICKSCAREKNIQCIHPDMLRYSLEALGFSVVDIIENVFHDKLEWSNDKSTEYVTCVSALLTNDIISENELYDKLCK